MPDYTLSKISTGDYKEKSSSFHAVAEPSSLINHVKFRLLGLNEEFSDSSHICYAYRIKQSGRLDEFASDSGEPKGSAGIHILNTLKRKQMVNSVIYVIRNIWTLFNQIVNNINIIFFAYKLITKCNPHIS